MKHLPENEQADCCSYDLSPDARHDHFWFQQEHAVSFLYVHCTLLPIKGGRFAYKEIFAGKDKFEYSERMKKLHSDFAEVNRKWGMARGSSIAETGARHRTTEEYRRMLSEECTSIEESIVRHQEVLSSLRSDIRLAERRVKGLTTMVDNIRQEMEEKQARLSAIENRLLSQNGDTAAILRQKEKLEQELSVSSQTGRQAGQVAVG